MKYNPDDSFQPFSEHGFPDNIQTYGLVSGLWTSTFALGAFIGPFISGLLYDYVGFRKGVIFIIVTQLLVGMITALFLIYYKKRAKTHAKLYKELDAQEPLIANHKHNCDSYGSTDGAVTGNGNGVTPLAGRGNGRVEGSNGTGNGMSSALVSKSPQIKDRKCYFNDPAHHQTTPPILSIA